MNWRDVLDLAVVAIYGFGIGFGVGFTRRMVQHTAALGTAYITGYKDGVDYCKCKRNEGRTYKKVYRK